MLQSRLFAKTSKNFPKDEESINAKYLLRAGYIAKNSAGVFTFLPLGLRVLNKISQIVREEMNALGAEELLMPALIAKSYWEASGRWNVPVVYKIKTDREEYGLGWTHEEVIKIIADQFILSDRDLPQAVYQIQNKFRMEPRARSGLLRGREFLMKDLYSFHKDEGGLNAFYESAKAAYLKIYKRLEMPVVVAEASGGDFTKDFTHEFQALVESGEDTIFHCSKCDYAQNKEVAKVKAGDACPKNCGGEVKESRAIEVGNIFRLGQRFSNWFMGSYGIGISRIMGTIVEMSHDDRGIIWPEAVAPFRVHLLALGLDKSEAVKENAAKLYETLKAKNIEVLFDDRLVPAGEKLFDADLLGIPTRLIVSEKTGIKIELKQRREKDSQLLDVAEVLQCLNS